MYLVKYTPDATLRSLSKQLYDQPLLDNNSVYKGHY
jgi:hypothetical protein